MPCAMQKLFMIDERSHTGMMALRHGNNFGSRSGDSMPDYDNVKVSFSPMGKRKKAKTQEEESIC